MNNINEPNVFVFRINYDEDYELIRNELIKNKTLRQGWGANGMDIRNSFEDFKKSWEIKWGSEGKNNRIKRKYNNLKIMTEIKVGDFIIIPKLSTENNKNSPYCNEFTVCKCKKEYDFQTLKEKDDFGHFIKIEDEFSCNYNYDSNTNLVSGKFCAYRSSLNKIYKDDLKKSITILSKQNDNKIDMNIGNSFLNNTNETIFNSESFLRSILERFDPNGHNLEELVRELFETNGFIDIGSNSYDGKGADADLIFPTIQKDTLISDLLEKSEFNFPSVAIQVKNKRGDDKDDIKGIEQLIKIKNNEKYVGYNISFYILISLADQFSQEAIQMATKNNIILINGKDFARLFAKYGLNKKGNIENNEKKI